MYAYQNTPIAPGEIFRHEDCALYRYAGDDVPDILFLQGNPYHRGYAHGVLLADKIAWMCAHMLTLLCGMTGGYTGEGGVPPTGAQVAEGKALMVAAINARLVPAIREELPTFFDELRGLTDGVQTKYPDITYEDMLIINTTPESVENPHGCSNVIAFGNATPDGSLIHGINMDYNSFGAYHRGITLCFVRPEEGYPYMGVGYCGSMFPMSFVNEKGISYGEMTSRSAERDWPQLPHWLQAKLMAMRAATLDEAVTIGKRTGGTSGFINFLCQGQRAVSIETAGALTQTRGPGSDRLGKDDLMFTTNFFGVFSPAEEPGSLMKGQADYFSDNHPLLMGRGEEMRATRNLSQWIDVMDCPRYKKFEELLPGLYGKLDAEAMKALMSTFPISRIGEHLTPLYTFCRNAPLPYGLPPEDLSNRDLASIYCLITEPERGFAHIAAGMEPAQAGRFMTVRITDGFEVLGALLT